MAHGENWYRNAAVRHSKNATSMFRKAKVLRAQALRGELPESQAAEQIADLVRRGCEQVKISVKLIDRYIAELEKYCK